MFLAAPGVHDRRLQPLGKRDKLLVRALAARSAENGDAGVTVQDGGKPLEIRLRGPHHRRRQQQAITLWQWRIDRRLQCNIAGYRHDRHATLADGFADRDLERARHLLRARDQLAIMAALAKQTFGPGFLEIAAADLRRRDLRCDREHRNTRAMAVVQAVDQMHVAGTAAAGTDGKLPGQMRFCTGRKGCDLLMADMDPLDLVLTAQLVGQTVQTVADDAVDAFDAGNGEDVDELAGYVLCHRNLPALCRPQSLLVWSSPASGGRAWVYGAQTRGTGREPAEFYE